MSKLLRRNSYLSNVQLAQVMHQHKEEEHVSNTNSKCMDRENLLAETSTDYWGQKDMPQGIRGILRICLSMTLMMVATSF